MSDNRNASAVLKEISNAIIALDEQEERSSVQVIEEVSSLSAFNFAS